MPTKDKVSEEDISFIPLSKENLPEKSKFKLEDPDLKEFLFNDSFQHEEHFVARTFIVKHKNEKIGFFSLASDAIPLKTSEKKRIFKVAFDDPLKQHKSFPALKIARLAICDDYQFLGIGTIVVETVAGLAITLSRSIGLRFVSVEAYPDRADDFYPKLGFERNKEKTGSDMVSMRRDLLLVASESKEKKVRIKDVADTEVIEKKVIHEKQKGA